jgi:hypothetical protein
MWNDIPFEYTGHSSLVIKGYVTGKIYQFAGKGSVQVIDYRDAGGLMAEPDLRKKPA